MAAKVIATPAPGTGSYSDTPPVNRYGIVSYRVVVDDGTVAGQATCEVGVAASGWVAFQDGLAPQASYDGTGDASLVIVRSGFNEYNSGANNTIQVGGYTDAGTDYKVGVIQFDLSSLPPSTTVSNAVLSLHYWYQRRPTDDPDNPFTPPEFVDIFVAPLLREWNEGRGTGIDGVTALCDEVTWQSARRYAELWETPGAFAASDVGIMVAEHELGTGGQYRAEWQDTALTAVVQEWIANPANNHGLKIASPLNGDMQDSGAAHAPGEYDFVSSNYPDPWPRPILMIDTGGGVGMAIHTGDVNMDGTVNIADAIALLSYLFGGADPLACMKGADANDDDTLNIADAIRILSYLFGQDPSAKTVVLPDGTEISPDEHPGCTSVNAADIPGDILGQPGCATPCTP